MTDTLRHMIELALQGELQGIHFWASVYLLVVLAGSMLHVLRVRRWPSTQGRLLRIGVGAIGGTDMHRADQEHVPDALYTYAVDDKPYQGSEISMWKMSASGVLKPAAALLPSQVHADADGNVRVYYHPKRPHKAVLLRPGLRGLMALAVMWLAVLVFYVWRW